MSRARYFSTLGVNAFTGRVFTAADDHAAAPPVVVLSHHVWQGTYGGDPAVVGSTLAIEGQAFAVAGVTPPGFFGETLRADPPDLWIPLQHEPMIAGGSSLLRQPVSAWLRVIGRLRPGATTEGMSARLTGLLHQWIQHDSGYPSNWMPGIIRSLPQQVISVVPAGAGVGIMREQYGRSLRILLGVCALVLLIACANVANLLLARAAARRGQTAVRLAMGASRRRIVTDALVESVLLAVAGAIAGLVDCRWRRTPAAVARICRRELSADRHHAGADGAGVRVRARTASPASCSAPRRRGLPREPIRSRRCAAPVVRTGDHASVARTTLLVVQATLSVVLVAGSTMLARSLDNLENQDFGYTVDGRVLVDLNRLPATYTQERLAALYRNVEERLNRLPGVQGAGLALYNPLTDNWGEGILVAGKPAPAPGTPTGSSWDRVSAHYLQSLNVDLVRGRYFTEADNETLAERRDRQRSVRPAVFHRGRGSDRSLFRPQHAGARQLLPHRRPRS